MRERKSPTEHMALFVLALASLALPVSALAQSDNFDGGTLDPAWKQANFNPALVNLSFPDSGNGKALRIQASPVPDAAPAAGILYRDDLHTNFYMAVDLVDWPGTDKNQAFVLLARATLTGNPVDTTGIIMNYDPSQYGESPTDRRQGQLQINMVTNDPPFGTKTIAVAECTLVPGRPYRFVFTGEGSHYTARVYDFHDLTQPVVTIEADDDIQGPEGGGITFDGGFKSGKFGILSFSREGNTGSSDVTLDNYFVGPTDPNPTGSTALAHPIPGTPVVTNRIPEDRFKNFHNPADGISFTANSYSSESVNAAATKLWLNGTDVSSQLILPASGTNISATLPGSALSSNTIYSAQIEVENADGTKRSTNTFWFDTFSDVYLSSDAVKTIEAEDYNYNEGEFQADPIPVSGFLPDGTAINGGGAGYLEQAGTEGVDFHDNRTSPEGPWVAEYRSLDPVGLSSGMYPEITDLNESEEEAIHRSDAVRPKYASSNLLEYVVHRTEPGEWLNYTREFTAGSYVAYLRVASFGTTEVELHQVTSDPAQPDQTTTKLGTFRIPNLITRYNYRYIPLVDEQGRNVMLNLSGRQTLRLQMAGTAGQDARKIAINYLLLAPQAEAAPELKLLSSATIDGTFTEETNATINPEAGLITLPVTGTGNRFFVLSGPTAQRITSATLAGGILTLAYQPQ